MKFMRGFLPVIVAACLLLTGAAALPAVIVWLDLPVADKSALAEMLLPRLPLAFSVLLCFFVVAGMLLSAIWRRLIVAPLQMAEQLQLMLEANQRHRLERPDAQSLRPLVAAVNRLADGRDALQQDVESQIRAARKAIEEERNRLAALMAELSQGVVACNAEGRILLYNTRAEAQFRVSGRSGEAAVPPIGLGRSIFSLFDRNLIDHALENLRRHDSFRGSPRMTRFICSMAGGQLMRVHMAPVPVATGDDASCATASSDIGGYVLMFDDITRAVENDARRDEILQSLTEGSRSALANIRAAIESLLAYPDIDAAQRERFLRVIDDEVRTMGVRLDKVVTDHADALRARWPLEEMQGADLLVALQRRIEGRGGPGVKIDLPDAGVWVRVDSFSLVQAVVWLAGRLQELLAVRLLHLRLSREGRLARLDLAWTGAPLSGETIHGLENEPMRLSGGSMPLTLHDVMERHGGELWFQRESATQQACFCLLLPAAGHPEPLDGIRTALRLDSRPEYYDFDLFRRTAHDRALEARPLGELAYTAFDTETTGLDPSAGDEIIQIGAVRIVNGRLLRHENFDRLVDPRRSMDSGSVAIHGITKDMLAGQPDIGRVLPDFHRFAEDTVLVAHNAAFDMRFLQIKEETTGIRFLQPVLDTLLLSMLLQPNQESHQLEAIAERFGVTVVNRHTALGDALITGEIFLRMIPLLEAMGIHTLGEALAAMRRVPAAHLRY